MGIASMGHAVFAATMVTVNVVIRRLGPGDETRAGDVAKTTVGARGEPWAVRWRPRRRRPWGGGRSSRAHEAAVALGGRSPRRDASSHSRNTPSDLWVEQRRITSGFGGGTRLAAEFLSAQLKRSQLTPS